MTGQPLKYTIIAAWNGNVTLEGKCSASVAHSFLRHALEQFTRPYVQCNRSGKMTDSIPSFAQLHSAQPNDTFVLTIDDRVPPKIEVTGVYGITLLAH